MVGFVPPLCNRLFVCKLRVVRSRFNVYYIRLSTTMLADWRWWRWLFCVLVNSVAKAGARERDQRKNQARSRDLELLLFVYVLVYVCVSNFVFNLKASKRCTVHTNEVCVTLERFVNIVFRPLDQTIVVFSNGTGAQEQSFLYPTNIQR